MKNILFLFSMLFLFAACADDDTPVFPVDDDGPVTPPEDTLVLHPAIYVAGDTTYGYVQGVWLDSFIWEASISIARIQDWHPTFPGDYWDMGFSAYHRLSGFTRHSLYLTEIPKNSVGTFKVAFDHFDLDDGFVGASFHTSTDDGDVGEDNYIVDETATDNLLTITEIDTVEQIYRGHFTVSFEINNPQGFKLNPNNPDKFTIRDAVFWVKLQE
ncbi:MAG: hypothetical protein R2825_17325 [Saprospiraceae bacterium]